MEIKPRARETTQHCKGIAFKTRNIEESCPNQPPTSRRLRGPCQVRLLLQCSPKRATLAGAIRALKTFALATAACHEARWLFCSIHAKGAQQWVRWVAVCVFATQGGYKRKRCRLETEIDKRFDFVNIACEVAVLSSPLTVGPAPMPLTSKCL